LHPILRRTFVARAGGAGDGGERHLERDGDLAQRPPIGAKLADPGDLLGRESRWRPHDRPSASTRSLAAEMRSLMARRSILAAQAMTARTTSAAGPSRAKPSLTDTSSTPCARNSSMTSNVSRMPERVSRSSLKTYRRRTSPPRASARTRSNSGRARVLPDFFSDLQSVMVSPLAVAVRSMAARWVAKSWARLETRR